MMRNPYRQMSIGFTWVFLAATAMSALVVLEDYAGYLINGFEYAYSWFSVPAKAFSNYWVWALLAPFIDGQASRISMGGSTWNARKTAAVIGVGLVVSLLHRVLAVSLFDLAFYLDSGFYTSLFSEKNQQLIGTGWVSSIIQYAVILFLFFAVVYYRQYLQKQKELSQAQMRALKMQLHPHFLFNTLHSVASLIDIEPKAAQKMLSQLGGLMRSTLEQDEKTNVSVEQELNYIRNYLDIEQVRFQDRLKIDYQIDGSAVKACVPYLILQPLVENAIKHGVQDMQESGLISIKVLRKGNRVLVIVSDNGNGSAKSSHGSGVGLRNVEHRLEALFGADYQMQAAAGETGGFEVSINFPYIETVKHEYQGSNR